jgi:hypothetical protein
MRRCWGRPGRPGWQVGWMGRVCAEGCSKGRGGEQGVCRVPSWCHLQRAPGASTHATARPPAHLLAELLRGQLVELDHLARQHAAVLEALREEHDLRHQRVVGDHHGHGPEQRLRPGGWRGEGGQGSEVGWLIWARCCSTEQPAGVTVNAAVGDGRAAGGGPSPGGWWRRRPQPGGRSSQAGPLRAPRHSTAAPTAPSHKKHGT